MAQIVPRIIDRICFTIGRSSIAIKNLTSERAIAVPEAYQPFVTSRDADHEIKLKVRQANLSGKEKIFESPPIWSLYRDRDQKVFSIFSQLPARAHTFYLSDRLTHSEIQFSQDFAKPLDPFCGPVLELLAVEQMSARSGCLLHGCGVQLSNTGILFAGRSGAGKSTMLGLWAEETDALILSDDRTIAQFTKSELRIYGTPWHGKARGGLPDSARLAGIFFLKHGQANAMRRLSTDDAVRRLLTCSFPPFWDAAGMSATLEFFNAVGRKIPCYELAFVPDESIVDYIRCWARG